MPQNRKISRNNTTVDTDSKTGVRTVTLHGTAIVQHWPNGKVRLCHGGWITTTTALRMTQTFCEWGLPLRVSRRKGVMTWERYNPENGETLDSGGFDCGGVAYVQL